MNRYITKPDVTKIFELLCGAIPNAKFTNDTIKAWMVMFGHVDRLRLLECAKQYLLKEGKFFPTVSEMNAELRKFDHDNTYWQPQKDKMDERCLWVMALNGITDPGDLTQMQVNTIYEIPEER